MILAALATCLVTACAGVSTPVVVGPLPQAREVVKRLNARRTAVRSFVMQGQISLVYPDGELYGDHLIQGVYPDHLRADIMGPFGRPVMSLATDGRRLTVLLFRENKAFQGPATRQNLGRFLGIPMSPAEIYALITGNPPLVVYQEATVVRAAGGGAQLKLLASGGAVGQGIDFDPTDYTVTSAWLRVIDGPVALRATYSDFQPWQGARYPRQAELRDSQGRTLTLQNDEMDLNRAVSGQLFTLRPPAAMKLEPLP